MCDCEDKAYLVDRNRQKGIAEETFCGRHGYQTTCEVCTGVIIEDPPDVAKHPPEKCVKHRQ